MRRRGWGKRKLVGWIRMAMPVGVPSTWPPMWTHLALVESPDLRS